MVNLPGIRVTLAVLFALYFGMRWCDSVSLTYTFNALYFVVQCMVCTLSAIVNSR